MRRPSGRHVSGRKGRWGACAAGVGPAGLFWRLAGQSPWYDWGNWANGGATSAVQVRRAVAWALHGPFSSSFRPPDGRAWHGRGGWTVRGGEGAGVEGVHGV